MEVICIKAEQGYHWRSAVCLLLLGVYFEQNVTTEKFEDYDGDRWVIVGE